MMDAPGRWLDGNGVAGLLDEVFGTDMTTVQRRCQSCGQRHPIGAHRAFRGAGTVLRCPFCGDVAARIGSADDRHVVLLAGAWLIEFPRR